MLCRRGPGASRAHGVRCCQGRRGRHAPRAAARFVRQSLDALFLKPLDPLVDEAAADPDRGGNIRNRHAISDEANNPAPSGTPCRHGGGALPRQERLALRRREADGERSFASTSHIDTSSAGQYGSLSHRLERTSIVPTFQGHHRRFLEEYHIFVHPCAAAATTGRHVGRSGGTCSEGSTGKKRANGAMSIGFPGYCERLYIVRYNVSRAINIPLAT